LQFEHINDLGTMTFRNFRWGTLTAPEAVDGDYNSDGIVDAADYAVWRKNVDAVGNPGEVLGDGDDGSGTGTPDGLVDDDDYAFWVSRFGMTSSGSGGGASQIANAPEPSGLVLVAATCALLLPMSRHRAKRSFT
jgi:hypothetical protein